MERYELEDTDEYSAGETGNSDYPPEDGWNTITLTPESKEYPLRLRDHFGDRTPRCLWVIGNAGLLSERLVMVCGSRNVSEHGAEMASRCGQILGVQGVVVASGLARGVDCAAHAGALDSGGKTLALTPYGLERLRLPTELRRNLTPERFAAMSELPPWMPFARHHALSRNLLLTLLSDAIIVVEPGESGGTWHSIRCAEKAGKPRFLIPGERHDLVKPLADRGFSIIGESDGYPLLDDVMASL